MERNPIFTKETNDFLIKNWDRVVQYIQIGVQPVSRVYQFLMNIGSKGELKERLSELSIDDLIHPYIIFFFEGDKKGYSLERYEKITISPAKTKNHPESELSFKIDVGKSLGELYENHKNYLGGWENIIFYDPRNNNSQTFVLTFLDSNGLLTKSIYDFFKQPTEQIMAGFDSLNNLIQKIVLMDLSVHHLLQGSSIN